MSEWGRRRGPNPKLVLLAVVLVVALIVIVVLQAMGSADEALQLGSATELQKGTGVVVGVDV